MIIISCMVIGHNSWPGFLATLLDASSGPGPVCHRLKLSVQLRRDGKADQCHGACFFVSSMFVVAKSAMLRYKLVCVSSLSEKYSTVVVQYYIKSNGLCRSGGRLHHVDQCQLIVTIL